MNYARQASTRPSMTKSDRRLARTMSFIFLDFIVAMFSLPLAVILLLIYLVVRLAR